MFKLALGKHEVLTYISDLVWEIGYAYEKNYKESDLTFNDEGNVSIEEAAKCLDMSHQTLEGLNFERVNLKYDNEVCTVAYYITRNNESFGWVVL